MKSLELKDGILQKYSGFSPWFLVALVVLLFLPFLGQAFHIDDVGFINPSHVFSWNPFQVHLDMTGTVEENRQLGAVLYENTHTPLMSFFIKVVTVLFGERESSLHGSFLIFPILALFSMGRLGALLFPGTGAVKTAMLSLFISMPAFLVNSHTIMSDVPTLALLLTAISCYIYALEREFLLTIWGGCLFLTLAIFASYQMLVFIPLLLYYAVLKKRISISVVISLIVPAVVLLVWLLVIYHLYGVFPVFRSSIASGKYTIASEITRGLQTNVLPGKIVNMVAQIGGSLLFVLLFYAVKTRSLRNVVAKFAVLASICFMTAFTLVRYSAYDAFTLALFVALGLLTLVEVVSVAFHLRKKTGREEGLFLLTWIGIVLLYNILVLPFGSARYILPALPPMVLLLMYASDDHHVERGRSLSFAVIVCFAAAFGLACSFADYQYAQTYKDFTREVKVFQQNSDKTFQVWYVGKWGMKYYMEKEGFLPLPEDSKGVRKGDFVIIPEMPRFWQPGPDLIPRLHLYATKEYRSWLPLRLFNRRSNAGFYAHHWGLLPFAISREPDEVFQIVEVAS